MKIKTVLMLLLIYGSCFGQWNTERGTVIKYDKVEHFIGCAGLYAGFRLTGLEPVRARNYTIIAQVLWEVKDHFMPWQKYGWWGGEGFCWRDLVAGSAGAYFGYWIDTKIVQPLFGEKVNVSYNGTLNIAYRF